MVDAKPTMWAWVADKCGDKCYHSCSGIAAFIERAMKRHYSAYKSDIWENNFDDIVNMWSTFHHIPEVLAAVTGFLPFCEAYGLHSDGCEDCIVAHTFGPCDNMSSILYFWYETLLKEVDIPLDTYLVRTIIDYMEEWYSE